MDKLRNKFTRAALVGALSTAALTACTGNSDGYSHDVSNVQCNDNRYGAKLAGDGIVSFIVHGQAAEDVSTIRVRRQGNLASMAIDGMVTGPQQPAEADGFSKPVPIIDGAELSAMTAAAAWSIDVRGADKNDVVIQGTCEGM